MANENIAFLTLMSKFDEKSARDAANRANKSFTEIGKTFGDFDFGSELVQQLQDALDTITKGKLKGINLSPYTNKLLDGIFSEKAIEKKQQDIQSFVNSITALKSAISGRDSKTFNTFGFGQLESVINQSKKITELENEIANTQSDKGKEIDKLIGRRNNIKTIKSKYQIGDTSAESAYLLSALKTDKDFTETQTEQIKSLASLVSLYQKMQSAQPETGSEDAIRYYKDLLYVIQQIQTSKSSIDRFTLNGASKFLGKDNLNLDLNKYNQNDLAKARTAFLQKQTFSLGAQKAKAEQALSQYIERILKENIQKISDRANETISKEQIKQEKNQAVIDENNRVKAAKNQGNGVSKSTFNIQDMIQLPTQKIVDELYKFQDFWNEFSSEDFVFPKDKKQANKLEEDTLENGKLFLAGYSRLRQIQKQSPEVLKDIISSDELEEMHTVANEIFNYYRDSLKNFRADLNNKLQELAVEVQAQKDEVSQITNDVTSDTAQSVSKGISKDITSSQSSQSIPSPITDENSALQKYIVSLDKAKQKALELSKVHPLQESTINKSNLNDFKDMLGYVERYISLGGKLEDIGIDNTNIRRITGKANLGDFSDEINKFKSDLQQAFGVKSNIVENKNQIPQQALQLLQPELQPETQIPISPAGDIDHLIKQEEQLGQKTKKANEQSQEQKRTLTELQNITPDIVSTNENQPIDFSIDKIREVQNAFETSAEAKNKFVEANKQVQGSVDESKSKLELEAELMKTVADEAIKAAESKDKFVVANKQVAEVAEKSSDALSKETTILKDDSADTTTSSTGNNSSGKKKTKPTGKKSSSAKNNESDSDNTAKQELEVQYKISQELKKQAEAQHKKWQAFEQEQQDYLSKKWESEAQVSQSSVYKELTDTINQYSTVSQNVAKGNIVEGDIELLQKLEDKILELQQNPILSKEQVAASEQSLVKLFNTLDRLEKKTAQNNTYKKLTDTISQYSTVNQRIAKGQGLEGDIQLSKQLKQKIDELKNSPILSQKQLNDTEESLKRINNLVDEIKKKQDKQQSENNNKAIQKAAQQSKNEQKREKDSIKSKAQNELNQLKSTLALVEKEEEKRGGSDNTHSKLKKAKADLLAVQKDLVDELSNIDSNFAMPGIDSNQTLTDLIAKAKQARVEFNNLTSAEKGALEVGRNKLATKMQKFLEENSGMANKYKVQLQELIQLLKDKGAEANLSDIESKFQGVQEKVIKAGQATKSFFDVVKEKGWYSLAAQIGTLFNFHTLIQQVKQGIQVVRELDTAFTEMRKVSDETAKSLREYQKTTFAVADATGSTAKQIQSSTADYMRLGKSLKEAKKLAKDTAILMNVSEFTDISAATDSLISMTQAYQELDDMDIINKLNLAGNNFSISTSDLAQSLQRSAAALKVAGNDLNEAIALTVAGNSILQDPDSVAAGLRVISLRITGTGEAKSELASLGEDVDDFVVQTQSKLDEKIRNYTAVASNKYKGISLLDDNGNYRSTYEILQDIADIYDEIVETDKKAGTNKLNAILEMVAGKNRSNILASVLQDGDLLRDVYSQVQNADGSAEAELEKYLDSIDGKIAKLTNRYQEFWVTKLLQ